MTETDGPVSIDEVDEDLVVPILEIEEIVSPSVTSLLRSDSNLSTVPDFDLPVLSPVPTLPPSSAESNTDDLTSSTESFALLSSIVHTENSLSVVPSLVEIQHADLCLGRSEKTITNLYTINHDVSTSIESKPFVTQVLLYGPKGKTSCFQANVDDGAMVNAIDTKAFNQAAGRLRRLVPSNRTLRMANGSLVPSQGVWKGSLKWGSVTIATSFEVFDSGGVWKMLIGKPLLEQLSAVHDYATDQISLPSSPITVIITNMYNTRAAPLPGTPAPPPKPPAQLAFAAVAPPRFLIASIPADDEKTRKVSANEQYVFELTPQVTQHQLDAYTTALSNAGAHIVVADKRPVISMATTPLSDAPCSPVSFPPESTPNTQDDKENNVWQVHADTNEVLGEIPDFPKSTQTTNVFTRHLDPFKPERVAEVMRSITIGEDLSEEQRQQVRALCEEFADTFALAVSEVYPVTFKTFKLTFPEGTTFSTKVNQRPLTPPQREYLYERLNELEAAGIIRRIAPEDVKAASPTVLAQKAHDSEGPSFEELLHRVNDQCRQHGLPVRDDLPPRPPPMEEGKTGATAPPKWRVCQNFAEINRASQIPPVPQGDIRAKQQRLCGHRWVSIIDFAAGFYAIPVDEDTQPYLSFYTEGRGYECYCRMPFGLTGAPTTFGDMAAISLKDQIGLLYELYVDDSGMAGSDFDDKLKRLRKFFE